MRGNCGTAGENHTAVFVPLSDQVDTLWSLVCPVVCLRSVITVPWMLQCTSYYCCYNRISAGSSGKVMFQASVSYSHTHIHTPLRHCCVPETQQPHSIQTRVIASTAGLCFGSVDAHPKLSVMNCFPQWWLVSVVAVNWELLKSQTWKEIAQMPVWHRDN